MRRTGLASDAHPRGRAPPTPRPPRRKWASSPSALRLISRVGHRPPAFGPKFARQDLDFFLQH
ncbi:MAG: hypothetical protein ACR2H3_17120 [Acidimicrobiales bacterium]